MSNKQIRKIKKIYKTDDCYGGMWKVAYADFVTAMMAFFLLLWILAISSKSSLEGIAKYFTPMVSSKDDIGMGKSGGKNPNIKKGFFANEQASSSLVYGAPSKGKFDIKNLQNIDNESDRTRYSNILNVINQNQGLLKFSDNIFIDVTKDGMRIQIMDSYNRPMFYPNTSKMAPYMTKILTLVAKIIKDQSNYIAIDGHTTTNYSDKGIDAWVLSAKRANEVKKFMDQFLNKEQVLKLIAHADKEPFDIKNPTSSSNIRVGITLLNSDSTTKSQKSSPTY